AGGRGQRDAAPGRSERQLRLVERRGPAAGRPLRAGGARPDPDGRLRDPPGPLQSPARLPAGRDRRAPGRARLPPRPRRRGPRRAEPADPAPAGGAEHGVRPPVDRRLPEDDAAGRVRLHPGEEHEPRRPGGPGAGRPGGERLRHRAGAGEDQPAETPELHRTAGDRPRRSVAAMKKLVFLLGLTSVGGGAWWVWPAPASVVATGSSAVVKRGDLKITVVEQGSFTA